MTIYTNPDARVLPEGWSAHYYPVDNYWYYTTPADTTRVYYTHPLGPGPYRHAGSPVPIPSYTDHPVQRSLSPVASSSRHRSSPAVDSQPLMAYQPEEDIVTTPVNYAEHLARSVSSPVVLAATRHNSHPSIAGPAPVPGVYQHAIASPRPVNYAEHLARAVSPAVRSEKGLSRHSTSHSVDLQHAAGSSQSVASNPHLARSSSASAVRPEPVTRPKTPQPTEDVEGPPAYTSIETIPRLPPPVPPKQAAPYVLTYNTPVQGVSTSSQYANSPPSSSHFPPTAPPITAYPANPSYPVNTPTSHPTPTPYPTPASPGPPPIPPRGPPPVHPSRPAMAPIMRPPPLPSRPNSFMAGLTGNNHAKNRPSIDSKSFAGWSSKGMKAAGSLVKSPSTKTTPGSSSSSSASTKTAMKKYAGWVGGAAVAAAGLTALVLSDGEMGGGLFEDGSGMFGGDGGGVEAFEGGGGDGESLDAVTARLQMEEVGQGNAMSLIGPEQYEIVQGDPGLI